MWNAIRHAHVGILNSQNWHELMEQIWTYDMQVCVICVATKKSPAETFVQVGTNQTTGANIPEIYGM